MIKYKIRIFGSYFSSLRLKIAQNFILSILHILWLQHK